MSTKKAALTFTRKLTRSEEAALKGPARSSRTVTKFLRLLTGDNEVELVRGNGYWYFSGGDTENWRGTSVSVYRITSFTIKEWLGEYQWMKEEYSN